MTIKNIGGSSYDLVLDRVSGNEFKAHWKNHEPKNEETRHLRAHWDVEQHKGNTRLHDYAAKGDVESAQDLIKRKQSVKLKGQNPVEKPDTIKVDVNPKNHDGNTPLHLAVQAGKTDMVDFLCEQEKLDVNSQNKDGNTPFASSSSSREDWCGGAFMRARET